jgi:hypothetical protein
MATRWHRNALICINASRFFRVKCEVIFFQHSLFVLVVTAKLLDITLKFVSECASRQGLLSTHASNECVTTYADSK